MNNKPPIILEFFLRRIISEQETESLPGDFEEMYNRIVSKKGFFYANVWYVFLIIKLIPSLIKHSILWSFIMFKHYTSIAFRNFKKQKVFSFVNISGLMVGMTCCILILLWVQNELSYDRFHENADNIYIVVCERERDSNLFYIQTTPAPTAPALKESYPEVINAARYRNLGKRLIRYGDIFDIEEDIAFADPSFFDIFTFPFVKGNPKAALEDLYSIVITEDMAVKYFGSEDPVGKTIFFGKEIGFLKGVDCDLTVTGVIKNIPENSSINFDFIAPFKLIGKLFNRDLTRWNFSFGFRSFVLLRDRTDYKKFNNNISGFINQNANWNVKTLLKPMIDIYRRGYNGEGVIKSVYIFTSLAVLTLIIACLNFINLSTARSGNRAREVGMRKVIGARRKELFVQFLGESVLISIISFTAAIMLVYILMPVFNNFAGKNISIDMSRNLISLLFITLIILLTGIVSGTYPAFVLSSLRPVKILKGSITSAGSKGSSIVRRILVTVQFSISIMLIICTIVISGQLSFVRNTDLGFNKEHLLYIEMNDTIKKNYESIRGDLLKNPAILNITNASSVLNEGLNYISNIDWEGRPKDFHLTLACNPVNFDYFKTMGMKFLDGRGISREHPGDMREAVVVNEEAAKVMKLNSPVGKRFSIGEREGKIIGVVKNFLFEPLYYGAFPTIYLYSSQNVNSVIIKISSENIPETIKNIERIFIKFNPAYPFVYNFIDETIEGFYRSELQMQKVFTTFAIFAIFIACLGMFGLSIFIAEKRTKEIGIRKVMGASTGRIVNLLTRNFIILVVLSGFIAAPAGYYFMNKWLENFAYKISIQWWVFVLSGLTALLIAILTVSYQSIKAARKNPVDTLRYE